MREITIKLSDELYQRLLEVSVPDGRPDEERINGVIVEIVTDMFHTYDHSL